MIIKILSILLLLLCISILLAFYKDTQIVHGAVPRRFKTDSSDTKQMIFFILKLFGFSLFAMAFFEIEIRNLRSGYYKENVSKHDYIFGCARMSIDLCIAAIFSFVIVFIIILLIASIFSESGGDTNLDCCGGACDCFNPHNLNMLCMNSNYHHIDCCCGVDPRS